jgi:ABC-2 type transport system permease protein
VIRLWLAAFRMQARTIRASNEYLRHLFEVPIFTVIFLSIIVYSGRKDLAAFGVVGPALMGLWGSALFVSGEIISMDKGSGTIDNVVAAPAPLAAIVWGRVLACTTLGLVGFVEAWLVADLLFDVDLQIHHLGWFVLAFVVTALAISGTSLLMAALFVRWREVRTVQMGFTYPFLVLGGVAVPVSYLPEWVRPLARLVFLSWSADLLRGALSPEPMSDPVVRLLAVIVLGTVALIIGWKLIDVMTDRVRADGTLSYA